MMWGAHLLEVVPVDTAAELLAWAAQVDDARWRALLELWQQQLRQQHRPCKMTDVAKLRPVHVLDSAAM